MIEQIEAFAPRPVRQAKTILKTLELRNKRVERLKTLKTLRIEVNVCRILQENLACVHLPTTDRLNDVNGLSFRLLFFHELWG